MSVFRKAMVWLGLVDDDEYYGDDDRTTPTRLRRRAPTRAGRPAGHARRLRPRRADRDQPA